MSALARPRRPAYDAGAVAGDFKVAGNVAGMIGRDQMLAAVFDPFHRPPRDPCRERDQKIFRIEFAAHAEAAADVVLHHPDRAFGNSHLPRQDAAIGKGHLGGAVHRQPPALPFGEEAARLDRHRSVALHLEPFAAHVRRVAECRFGVALHGGERGCDIAPRCLEQDHAASFGGSCVRRHGKRRDIDRDCFGRILGDGRAVGDDDGDRFADIADRAVGDDRLLEWPERRKLLLPQRDRRNRARYRPR